MKKYPIPKSEINKALEMLARGEAYKDLLNNPGFFQADIGERQDLIKRFAKNKIDINNFIKLYKAKELEGKDVVIIGDSFVDVNELAEAMNEIDGGENLKQEKNDYINELISYLDANDNKMNMLMRILEQISENLIKINKKLNIKNKKPKDKNNTDDK